MANYSRQKATILQVISANKHIDVKKIHELAKNEVPNLSLATTYRNIEKLEQEQEIQRVQITNELSLFEKYLGPHHHFICQQCHQVTDLPAPDVQVCTSCLETKNKFEISHVSMNVFGTCAQCSN